MNDIENTVQRAEPVALKPGMRKARSTYHHGNLAESLLDAVDQLASQFGLEAVTLRACAKLVGVSPSSAFRHYADKRELLTAFATRALRQLIEVMSEARDAAESHGEDTLHAVCMAYVAFALDKPAFFRAMWREETIYTGEEQYTEAISDLRKLLQAGFAGTLTDLDPHDLSAEELLAWSAVHGLAMLFVEDSLGTDEDREQKMARAKAMVGTLRPAFVATSTG